MMGGMGARWRAPREPLLGSVREGVAPGAGHRVYGYTGIMESVAIAASPAVGSGGPGGANAWPTRLHYIRWLPAVHYIPHLVAGGYYAEGTVGCGFVKRCESAWTTV